MSSKSYEIENISRILFCLDNKLSSMEMISEDDVMQLNVAIECQMYIGSLRSHIDSIAKHIDHIKKNNKISKQKREELRIVLGGKS